MIHVGNSVLVTKNVSKDSKYDFTVGKEGVVVSIDKSSTYPYQVRCDDFSNHIDSKALRFKEQELQLV